MDNGTYNDPTYMLIYINHDWMNIASNCDSSIGGRHPLLVRWEFLLFTISNIQLENTEGGGYHGTSNSIWSINYKYGQVFLLLFFFCLKG